MRLLNFFIMQFVRSLQFWLKDHEKHLEVIKNAHQKKIGSSGLCTHNPKKKNLVHIAALAS